jgi:hypothetical protein
MTAHQRREALHRMDAGESIVDLARTFGVDRATLYRMQNRSPGMTTKTEAVVYYPPKERRPFFAVIISDGRVLACEPLKSLSEGEMVLSATMKELPRLIQQAKEEADA